MHFNTIEELEKDQIRRVLSFTEDDKKKAAKILGISTATIYRKIDQYQIKAKGEKCTGQENTSLHLTAN